MEQLKLTMRAQAEEERNALLQANEARAAEFMQKQDEFKAEQERLHSQKDENTRIQEELAALEGKIMHGGEHVKDRVARQQKGSEPKSDPTHGRLCLPRQPARTPTLFQRPLYCC